MGIQLQYQSQNSYNTIDNIVTFDDDATFDEVFCCFLRFCASAGYLESTMEDTITMFSTTLDLGADVLDLMYCY